jgi:hypothetical protein
MNLAAREQRVLDGIATALQVGEPVRAENLVHRAAHPAFGRDDHPSCARGLCASDHTASRVAAAVPREEIWKTAEILILRHQPAVLQRRQLRRPNLNLADRALFGLMLKAPPGLRRHAAARREIPAVKPMCSEGGTW